MHDYRLEHVTSYSATLESPPEVIGPLPEGIRVNFYVTGGKAEGPRLNGRLRPVGGDWLTIRRDGVGVLDVRATIETPDEALIYVAYNGVAELGEDGYEKFLAGETPERFPLRTAPRLYSAHPDYQWVNRLQFISVGEADLSRFEVHYDVYALR
ncbi:hypothetical protein PC39_15479 [Salinisphaera sp. PC39]|uniref:DUF3237 domain-containing protein n=1 Tax=Salinisphaera sp. PC39 TaxID=1304156 RepID=UPI00333F6A57